jgi:hypothetical protein
MKTPLLLFIFLFTCFFASAQIPQKINYQGIARNSSGAPLASTNIGLRLSIRNTTATGTITYQETQTATTNAYGLYNVAIGTGTVTVGTFLNINWGTGAKYLQVEVDPAGGTSYTDLGAHQLLSVPYALNGISGGTANYIPKFTSGTSVGNSAIYQSGTNKVGIGTTSPGWPLTLFSSTDTIINIVAQQGTPTLWGSSRTEYTGTADVARVGILGSSLSNYAHSSGIGVEGLGNQVGVLGYGASSTATQVAAVEGDGYGTGSWAIGVLGNGDRYSTGTPTYAVGVLGMAQNGLVSYAGYFNGNVNVVGSVSKLGGTFKIDHPLDPDNKYLSHSFVESPDMMNIYNGNITTDATGTAVVTLPSYFEALNQDFRYQLTVIGTFAQAIISKEITDNTFEIKTSVPNVKVSWMVTGVRHDAWASANRIAPEQEKESFNKGKYLTAKELGKPADTQIGADIKSSGKAYNKALPVSK